MSALSFGFFFVLMIACFSANTYVEAAPHWGKASDNTAPDEYGVDYQGPDQPQEPDPHCGVLCHIGKTKQKIVNATVKAFNSTKETFRSVKMKVQDKLKEHRCKHHKHRESEECAPKELETTPETDYPGKGTISQTPFDTSYPQGYSEQPFGGTDGGYGGPVGQQDPNPFGQGSTPYGQGSNPFGQGSTPFGQGSPPSSQDSNPFGQGSDQFGQGSNPFGQGSNPSSQGSNPFGQGSNPSSQGSNPFGQGSGQFGQGSNPFGQGSDQFGQGSNPFGQNTNVGTNPGSTTFVGNPISSSTNTQNFPDRTSSGNFGPNDNPPSSTQFGSFDSGLSLSGGGSATGQDPTSGSTNFGNFDSGASFSSGGVGNQGSTSSTDGTAFGQDTPQTVFIPGNNNPGSVVYQNQPSKSKDGVSIIEPRKGTTIIKPKENRN